MKKIAIIMVICLVAVLACVTLTACDKDGSEQKANSNIPKTLAEAKSKLEGLGYAVDPHEFTEEIRNAPESKGLLSGIAANNGGRDNIGYLFDSADNAKAYYDKNKEEIEEIELIGVWVLFGDADFVKDFKK